MAIAPIGTGALSELRTRERASVCATGSGTRLVRVLGEDPDLGAALEPAEWELAGRAAVAPVIAHARGPWSLTPSPDPASFGALVLKGLIVVRMEIDGRGHIELLGEGDVISPWSGAGPDLALPSVVTATVVSELRLALLDRGFVLRTARWPVIHAALMRRLLTRSRRLSLQAVINSLTRVEERLELTFWFLAFRFGRVTAAGHTLELGMTHAQLADLISAHRPSVTIALGRLAEAGRLVRLSREKWLLPGPPPEKLARLAQQTGVGV